MPTYASGHHALAVCDVCGFTYKLRRLKETFGKGRPTGIRSCPSCWDADHPQTRLGELPVFDPQALRKPRPDSGQYAESRAQVVMAVGAQIRGYIGIPTVTGS